MKKMLLLLLVLNTFSIYAGEINGKIAEENKFPYDPVPISEIKIYLYTQNNKHIDSVFSNKDGLYYFLNTNIGNCTLKVKHNNKDFKKPISINQQQQIQSVDLFLLEDNENINNIRRNIFENAITSQANKVDSAEIMHNYRLNIQNQVYIFNPGLDDTAIKKIRRILQRYWIDIPYTLSRANYNNIIAQSALGDKEVIQNNYIFQNQDNVYAIRPKSTQTIKEQIKRIMTPINLLTE